ncbi:phosphohistidine phosphatase SixA [Bisgaard Taxon 10/6]|uniref:phosphohistidine phosphatase SixA n=1 Tax=Exercitatus varius TaxID=67857 RepID=UPI00294B67C3|nr:phosphohistidine phosphatase SixA [Exercitatus varius]MDG2916587.1 phosphohistidine phosphatase SixA [Exercitatus varius]
MRIIVMRHGEAEMLAPSDKERHLTQFGKTSSFQQSQWLKTWLNSTALDKVIVSPYARALETFEQINAAFGQSLTSRAETWDAITPYGNTNLVRNYLEMLAEDQEDASILLVSHLPLVGEIVTEFCGRNTVSFHPATIACIDWDGETGKVIEIKYP